MKKNQNDRLTVVDSIYIIDPCDLGSDPNFIEFLKASYNIDPSKYSVINCNTTGYESSDIEIIGERLETDAEYEYRMKLLKSSKRKTSTQLKAERYKEYLKLKKEFDKPEK